MRNKRWLEQARSLGDESDLLDTIRRSVMEVEIATKRILNLIAWVDVEFAAIFAAARNECHGVGRQPQLVRPLACFCEVPHDALKINIWHLERWNGEQHDDAPFIPVSGPAFNLPARRSAKYHYRNWESSIPRRWEMVPHRRT